MRKSSRGSHRSREAHKAIPDKQGRACFERSALGIQRKDIEQVRTDICRRSRCRAFAGLLGIILGPETTEDMRFDTEVMMLEINMGMLSRGRPLRMIKNAKGQWHKTSRPKK